LARFKTQASRSAEIRIKNVIQRIASDTTGKRSISVRFSLANAQVDARTL